LENTMYQERQGLLPQSTQGLDGAFILPSAEEAHMAELEKGEEEDNNPVIQTHHTVTTEEMIIAQKARRKTERRLEALRDGRSPSKAKGKGKSAEEHIKNQAKLRVKFGSAQMAVENEFTQVSGSDPDFSSSPITYVPPEDPQILAKLTQSEIDLSLGAKIPRGLPDPLDQYASIIKSITDDQEIAGILIEEQMRGNLNGPGSSQIEPFSFNPLHRWGAPDADDYGPDSRP